MADAKKCDMCGEMSANTRHWHRIESYSDVQVHTFGLPGQRFSLVGDYCSTDCIIDAANLYARTHGMAAAVTPSR